MSRDRLFNLLKTRAFQEREVTLSSGKRSNFYIDCKQVSLHAEGACLIGQEFYALMEKLAPEAEAVGGLTLGADPLATATSIASFSAGKPRNAFIVRKEPKGHGTNQYVETPGLVRGAKVVIVEDVVTTGASTLKAIEGARTAGFDVLYAFALVDRLDGGREAVESSGVKLESLFTRDNFLPRV